MGNHDYKLLRRFVNPKLPVSDDVLATLQDCAGLAPETTERWKHMLHALPHQIRGQTAHPGGDGQVTYVHAAAPIQHLDQANPNSLARNMYGYPEDGIDSNGHIKRMDWARDYDGTRLVVHGHPPQGAVSYKTRVMCLDTGAVFGGHLTALSLDRMELTQVASPLHADARQGVSRFDARPPVLPPASGTHDAQDLQVRRSPAPVANEPDRTLKRVAARQGGWER